MRALPISILSLALLAELATPTTAGPWLAISPEDLAMRQGRVQADADAEAIHWEIVVSDEWSGDVIKSSETNYLRIKIFNTRGRDAFNRIDIPYAKGTRLDDVAARTIRPDGSVVAVKKDAILERTILKGNGLKVRVKSIAMPAVDAGCIVEYRWTSIRYDQLSHNTRIVLQKDFPVENIRLSIHPLPVPVPDFSMRIRAFNFLLPPFTEESGGIRSMTLSHMPAFHREDFAPPELSVRPWIIIYYANDSDPPASAFWRQFGKELYQNSSSLSRASSDVKRVTQTVLAGATDQDIAVERLLGYCTKNLRNTDLSDSGLTEVEREWLESEHSPSDYLKRGLADSDGVLKVFLAMATAAGLDARFALLPDRSESTFKSSESTYYLLTRRCAAVLVMGNWRAIDPSAADHSFGLLPWRVQGVEMLVPDPEEPFFIRTPVGTPEQSVRQRSARLKLSEDGTIEGDISYELSGQDAADRRSRLRNRSIVEREKELTDQVKSRLSTAELSSMRFDPGTSSSESFRMGFHVRVPGYAQRTAQRIFLQPAFFQRGISPPFSSARRTQPVLFDYAWGEMDAVTIELPPGYHLEAPAELPPVQLPGVGRYSFSVRLSEDGHVLQLLRTVLFGIDGKIYFPVEEYPGLKKAFDQFHAQDETTITLVSDAAAQR